MVYPRREALAVKLGTPGAVPREENVPRRAFETPSTLVYLDCGWSGHGFQHSPVTGHVISEVILTGRYPEGLDASEFSVTLPRGADDRPLHALLAPKYGA